MTRITLFILFIIPISLIANTSNASISDSIAYAISTVKGETVPNINHKKLTVSFDIQELYTTHYTYFTGTSLTLNYPVSKAFYLGVGAEYSHSNFHDDNGWNITKLNFIPVYLNSKIDLAKWGGFTHHFQLSTGITFKNYQKVWSNNPAPEYTSRYKIPPTGVYHISEVGWYMYSGIGISYKINEKLSTYIDVGIKAFHMSWNAWQINPRGLIVKLGIIL